MKNGQNLTIALLLATAMILTALLISSYQSQNNIAYAEASVKDGDFILGSGALTQTTDLVYVIDIGARRLNVYFTDNNAGSIDLADSVDLDRAFTAGQ